MRYTASLIITSMLCLSLPLFAQEGEKYTKIEFDSISAKSFGDVVPKLTNDQTILYLTGEAHHAHSTNEIHLAFIKYLILHKNLGIIFIESGNSYGELLNQYLASGNDAHLRFILKSYGRNQRSYFNYYKEIASFAKQHHLTLAFRGVDVEYNLPGALAYILHTFGPHLSKSDSAELVSFQEQDMYLRKVEKNFLATLKRILAHSTIQDKAKLERFDAVINGIEAYLNDFGKRNSIMANKVLTYYEENPLATGYFPVGIAHLRGGRVFKDIRTILQQKLGKDKILLSAINYIDCLLLDGSQIQPQNPSMITGKPYAVETGRKNFDLWLIANGIK